MVTEIFGSVSCWVVCFLSSMLVSMAWRGIWARREANFLGFMMISGSWRFFLIDKKSLPCSHL